MTITRQDAHHGPGVVYRDIEIRRFDVPCTPWVWTHCEADACGSAETLEEAQEQIDRHLAAREVAA
ncbi:hypothetical protein ACEUZ9_002938 [Paracoccus litorisediminis]|uniref:hypothetical protein n=1 Tax=Paracoccus litorisediminis TaxID=2006130 RepID=UPI003731AF19